MAGKKRVLADNLDPRVQLIFKIMEERHISNKEMAGFIGASESNVSDWGKGRARPGAEVMPLIADFLDCSLDYLMGRTQNPLSHKEPSTMSVGTVSGNSGVIGVGNMVTQYDTLDSHQKLIIDIYNSLSPEEQVVLIHDIIFNYKDKNKTAPKGGGKGIL